MKPKTYTDYFVHGITTSTSGEVREFDGIVNSVPDH